MMSQEKREESTGGESYSLSGSVGAGATAIVGKNITNIQQMFPKTADGEFLSQQFKALVEEIGSNKDLDDKTRELAIEKTVAVAGGLAKAAENPNKLKDVLKDAKEFLARKASWAWDKMQAILTSEAVQKTLGTITEAAVRGAITSITGGL